MRFPALRPGARPPPFGKGSKLTYALEGFEARPTKVPGRALAPLARHEHVSQDPEDRCAAPPPPSAIGKPDPKLVAIYSRSRRPRRTIESGSRTLRLYPPTRTIRSAPFFDKSTLPFSTSSRFRTTS